ncbi:MAG: ABC transporter substrate-binding protein, partial [Tissierellia bacterium]|nr:ABC transporter substrate-binding protein [Tissierellia bacterium]
QLEIASLVKRVEEEKTEEKTEENDGKFVLEYPEEFQESYGKELVLDKKPEHILIMTIQPVMTFYKLGINMDVIPESWSYPWPDDIGAEVISWHGDIDVEEVMSKNPDLIIMSEFSANKYKHVFEENNVPVYISRNFKTIEKTLEDMDIYAKAFGKEDKAAEIRAEIESEVEKLKENGAKGETRKILILSGVPIQYVQSENGFVGHLFDLLGMENVTPQETSSTGMYEINMENVVSKNPDLIICIGKGETAEEVKELYAEEFNKNIEVWEQVDGFKNDNIIYLDKGFANSCGINIINNLKTMNEMFKDGVK